MNPPPNTHTRITSYLSVPNPHNFTSGWTSWKHTFTALSNSPWTYTKQKRTCTCLHGHEHDEALQVFVISSASFPSTCWPGQRTFKFMHITLLWTGTDLSSNVVLIFFCWTCRRDVGNGSTAELTPMATAKKIIRFCRWKTLENTCSF